MWPGTASLQFSPLTQFPCKKLFTSLHLAGLPAHVQGAQGWFKVFRQSQDPASLLEGSEHWSPGLGVMVSLHCVKIAL